MHVYATQNIGMVKIFYSTRKKYSTKLSFEK